MHLGQIDLQDFAECLLKRNGYLCSTKKSWVVFLKQKKGPVFSITYSFAQHVYLPNQNFVLQTVDLQNFVLQNFEIQNSELQDTKF